MNNKKIKIEIKDDDRKNSKKILKAGFDLNSLYEAILSSQNNTAVMVIAAAGFLACGIVFHRQAAIYNEMLINQIIIEGTQKFFDSILGLEAGVTREGFIYLDNVFLKYHRDLIDQERIIEAIIKRLETYYNTQALQDVEGPKFKQVILELKRKLQEVRELKEKTTE